MNYIQKNFDIIRENILEAAQKSGRKDQDIKIIAVTKTRSIQEINMLKDYVGTIGENKLQELTSKYEDVKKMFDIHFIGHLQTNKVKDAVKMVSMIQSVDSLKLAKKIDQVCKGINKTMNILLRVNTSFEESKYGINPKDLCEFIKQISELDNLKVKGLMTMAMLTNNKEKIRDCFKLLKDLLDKNKNQGFNNIDLTELSMGMSHDYKIAVEEGATIVRIGRAFFN